MSDPDISLATKKLAHDLKILVFVQAIALCVVGLLFVVPETIRFFYGFLAIVAMLVLTVSAIWGCVKLMTVVFLPIPIWLYIGSVFLLLFSFVFALLASPDGIDSYICGILACVFPFYSIIPQFFIARWLAKRKTMECNYQTVLRYQKKWVRFIFIVLTICLVGGVLGWQYRAHLVWKYAEWNGNLDVKAISYSEMPAVDIPEDWVECTFGCLRFYLPPNLATLHTVTREPLHIAVYGGEDTSDDSLTVRITIPTLDHAMFILMLANASHHFPNRENLSTPPRMRLEFCKISADDFRWSMSSEDVSRLVSLVTLRGFMISGEAKNAETFFHDDIDRIVLYSAGAYWFSENARIDWACTITSSATNAHTGTIFITDNDETRENNQEFIQGLARKISQSMRVVCTCSHDDSSFENDEAE